MNFLVPLKDFKVDHFEKCGFYGSLLSKLKIYSACDNLVERILALQAFLRNLNMH